MEWIEYVILCKGKRPTQIHAKFREFSAFTTRDSNRWSLSYDPGKKDQWQYLTDNGLIEIFGDYEPAGTRLRFQGNVGLAKVKMFVDTILEWCGDEAKILAEPGRQDASETKIGTDYEDKIYLKDTVLNQMHILTDREVHQIVGLQLYSLPNCTVKPEETEHFTIYKVFLDGIECLQVRVTNKTETTPFSVGFYNPLPESNVDLTEQKLETIDKLGKRVREIWDELDKAIRRKLVSQWRQSQQSNTQPPPPTEGNESPPLIDGSLSMPYSYAEHFIADIPKEEVEDAISQIPYFMDSSFTNWIHPNKSEWSFWLNETEVRVFLGDFINFAVDGVLTLDDDGIEQLLPDPYGDVKRFSVWVKGNDQQLCEWVITAIGELIEVKRKDTISKQPSDRNEVDGEIPAMLLDREEMQPYCSKGFSYVPKTARHIIDKLPDAEKKADYAFEKLTVTRLANEVGVSVETTSRYLSTIKKAGFSELLGVQLPGK